MSRILTLPVTVVLLLPSVYVPHVAGATTSAESEVTCLADAVPFEQRKFLSVGSVEMPVGFWVNDWASAQLSAHVAMVVLREAMGVHTVQSGLGGDSTPAVYATAGCEDPVQYANEEGRACSVASHARSPHHVSLELWGAVASLPQMEERLADIPSVYTEDAGSIGYVGNEGLYVFEQERLQALESTGMDLGYYRFWDAQWFEPWRYFAKMTDVDNSLLKPCSEVERLNDPVDAATYLLHTGDAGGLEFDASTNEPLGFKCLNGTWWVSPACRDDLSKCVVSLTGGSGWSLDSNMQRAAILNMPLALGTGLTTGRWGDIGRNVPGAHYWYTPDVTFVDLRPTQVIFPPLNEEEKQRGKLDSADAASPLSKVIWNQLGSVAPNVRNFILNLAISEEAINALLLDALQNSSHSYEAVACRWVRANRAVWEAWIPSETQCSAGLGLVNSTGGFVDSLDQGAISCAFCPPGRYSMEITDATSAAVTRTCELCELGTSQQAPLQVECESCAAGYFAATRGQDECDICPEAWFQPDKGSSACLPCPTPAVTRLLGATTEAHCVCPPGRYQPAAGMAESGNSSGSEGGVQLRCLSCPPGMECRIDSREEWVLASPQASANFPSVLPGFMSIASEPLTIYKCMSSEHCPGGRPGSCGELRDSESVACAACDGGRFAGADDSCQECQGWQTILMLIFAPIVIMLVMIALAWAANKERIAEANSGATCAIVAGLTCQSIQTMSVLNSIEVDWKEPLKSTFTSLSFIGFDMKIIGTGCIIDGGAGTFILRQLVAPLLAMWLLLITFFKKRFFHPHLEISVHLANSAGSLCMLVFISIVLSGVMPLICYKHPGDAGESMSTQPDVLCFHSDVHSSMLAVGLLGLACVPVPFFVVVLWATLQYPSFVKRSQMNNGLQLRRFYFLFRRFQPHGYYYGALLLTRSLMICLVPVVFRDNGPAHLLLLAAILAAFGIIQSILRPWRGALANALDTTISALIILLLFCGALSHTDPKYLESTISAFAHFCLIAFILILILSLCVALVQYSRPSPYYHRFVCHHKAAAAAQARFLQLLLQFESGRSCFIDSDDLMHLDDLFDTVRVRVGLLVVYLTADTLRRPWCAGEVTTAYKARVKATRVITPSFQMPGEDSVNNPILSGYLDHIGKEFTEAGIIERDLVAALKWVLSGAVPAIEVNESQVGTHKLMDVTQELLKEAIGKHDRRRSARQPGAGAILLSSELGNDEATAVAGILGFFLQEWAISKTGHMIYVMSDMPELAGGFLSLAALQSFFQKSYGAIVVLTAGSLTSRQLSSIVMATEVSEHNSSYDVIHVCTPEFQFPTTDFYTDTMVGILEHGIDSHRAHNLLQAFFRNISIRFTPSASRKILETEAGAIRKRMRERKTTDIDANYKSSSILVATRSSPDIAAPGDVSGLEQGAGPSVAKAPNLKPLCEDIASESDTSSGSEKWEVDA